MRVRDNALDAQSAFCLASRRRGAYSPLMDNTRHHRPIDWEPPTPSEAELRAALADSEAEVAAGLFVDGDALIRDLYADAERLEAELAAGRSQKVMLRR